MIKYISILTIIFYFDTYISISHIYNNRDIKEKETSICYENGKKNDEPMCKG